MLVECECDRSTSHDLDAGWPAGIAKAADEIAESVDDLRPREFGPGWTLRGGCHALVSSSASMSTPRSRSGSGTFSIWTGIASVAGDRGGVHLHSRLPRSLVTQPGSGRRAWLSRHSVMPARAASHSGLMWAGG